MAALAILPSSMAATNSSSSPPPLMASPGPILHWSPTSICRRRKPKYPLRISASSLADASALLNAAHHTVDTYIKSGMIVGLGSGQASTMAIQYLGRKLRTGAFKDILGIPMSVVSASEAAKAGIPLDDYQDNSQIDFAFDDADVIEEGTLTAIIGRRSLQGDELLIQEKSILNAAENLVFLISKNQYKGGLEGAIPVLVHSFNWLAPAEEIDDLFLGDAEVWRRPTIGHADPLGGQFPLVTREGHNILDVIFTSPIESLDEVAKSLDKIDGVVDHGVISKFPCTAVIASESGLCIVDNLSKNSVKGV
ncbi:Ribose 5-phosphate isomerase, type A [Trema orientale]|uniref:ribose-5-phosphate isomerase n=1 Tax=Trema orientale TaxID=63057 RepID=A0A2P5FZT6_TREOI|nr:Ribose 5-phosphate isomerase, type A [Trema orientale]